jgi:release factor glutamine methyltransferase
MVSYEEVDALISGGLSRLSLSSEQLAAEKRLFWEAFITSSTTCGWEDRWKFSSMEWQQKGAVPVATYKTLQQMLQKRVEKRIPIQYVLEQAYFWNLRFYVTPDVLIPRPETEHLVAHALAWIKTQQGRVSSLSIADICTGSGAIALSVLSSLKTDPAFQWLSSVEMNASDISQPALVIAKKNAEQFGLTHAITFLHGDLLKPFVQERIRASGIDLLLCNPPYIAPDQKDTLTPEVLQEPLSALFAEENGLFFYRKLAEASPQILNTGAAVFMEVGAGMGEAVVNIFQKAGFNNCQFHPDLAGYDRIVEAHFKP